MIPGSGPRRGDCLHEWLTSPVPSRGRSGAPLAELVCEDDDPGCDFGANTGDAACLFHVALCLNVSERRFVDRAAQPLCTPTDVAWVIFTAPREADPRDATEAANRDALEAALASAGAAVRRQCQPPGVVPNTPCASDSDCGGTRRCRTRFMLFTPPLDVHDRCTAFADVVVPLRLGAHGAGTGTRTLRLSSGSSIAGAARDSDVLKLVCRPRPAP